MDLEFHSNLQNGAQVDRRTRAGQATSLHRAAYAGHTDVVKVLLQHGADVKVKDTDGQTPLHKACKCTLSRINKFCIGALTLNKAVQRTWKLWLLIVGKLNEANHQTTKDDRYMHALYTMQDPSFLGKINLVSIWFRMVS